MSAALVKYSYALSRGWEAVRHLRNLEKSQWLPVEEIQKIQLKKLKRLVGHAYNNVPFYHEKFKKASLKPQDIRTLTDLQKLPITTKTELKAYTPDKTVARNCSVHKLKRRQTGGTTGRPFIFFKDQRTVAHELAALCWFRSWYGSFGFRQALLRFVSYLIPWSKASKSFQVGWLVCDRSTRTLWKYAHWMKTFKPKVLEGPPAGFYALVNFIKKEEIQHVVLPVLLATSETLFAFQRDAIQSALKCRVFNHYSSSEIASIAQECEEHTGLHINAVDRVVEFTREGESVTSGELGEAVITDLENYAMPFIRYNIEDVGVSMDGLCSCGRNLPLIKEIKGRISDLILASDGKLVAGDILAGFILFRGEKWTEQFQAIQQSKGELLIRIVKARERREEDSEFVLGEIRKRLGNVKVRTELVKAITPPPSGKHRFVISEVSNEFFSHVNAL